MDRRVMVQGVRPGAREISIGFLSRSLSAPLAVVACLVPVSDIPAIAQDAAVRLPTVVVTGSRIPTAQERLPAATTVITKEDIEAQQPASAVDILRAVPGLYVDQVGGSGGVSSVYLRGADPNYTVVMIDGVRVNDPSNSRGGSYDLSLLAPELIERVEVVRGPMSAVFGSDALAGVINIITRKENHEPGASARAAVGGYGYRNMVATAQSGDSDSGVALGLSYLKDGEVVIGNYYSGHNATANIVHDLDDSTALSATLQASQTERRSFPDDSGGPDYAVRRDVDEREDRQVVLGTALTHDLPSEWRLKAEASHFYTFNSQTSPGVAPGVRSANGIPPNFSDNHFRRSQLNASATRPFGDKLKVTAGTAAEYEKGASAGGLILGATVVPSNFTLTRTNIAPFGELQVTPVDSLLLHASFRWDNPSDFDSELSPRLGASYELDESGTTLRASWGKAFKLPSFFALSSPIVGNPALLPERAESYEVGVTQELFDGTAEFEVTAFFNRYKNLIDLEEGPPLRLVNRSRVYGKGAEMNGAWHASDEITFGVRLTYVETDIDDSDENLRNRPRWVGGGSATWRPGKNLTFNLDASYTGKSLDSSVATGDVWLDPYLLVNLTGKYQLGAGWSLFAAADNLLDSHYEEYVGFTDRGLRMRMGTEVRF